MGHRASFALVAAGLVAGSTLAHSEPSNGPKVRDQQSKSSSGPTVRDHRSKGSLGPTVRDHRSSTGSTAAPTVRDHRAGNGATVRDHRSGDSSYVAASDVVVYDDEELRPRRRIPLLFPMLPFKLDFGGASAATSRGVATGVAGSLGIHWASLAARPTDIDVGIGLFASEMSVNDTGVMTRGSSLDYVGGYVELGHTLTRSRHARTWASGRAEYIRSSGFGDNAHYGLGASARLSAELFTSGTAAGGRSVYHGTLGVGLYVEAAVRDTAADSRTFCGTMGLSLRTPFVLFL